MHLFRLFCAISGPVVYWAFAAWAIMSARNDPDVFAWLLAAPLTAPVSFLVLVVEPGPEWERSCFTFWTTAGAVVNGLFMMWLAWRLTLPTKQSTRNIQQNTADYDDSIESPGAREAK